MYGVSMNYFVSNNYLEIIIINTQQFLHFEPYNEINFKSTYFQSNCIMWRIIRIGRGLINNLHQVTLIKYKPVINLTYLQSTFSTNFYTIYHRIWPHCLLSIIHSMTYLQSTRNTNTLVILHIIEIQ